MYVHVHMYECHVCHVICSCCKLYFFTIKIESKDTGTTVSSQNLETYIYLYPVFYIFKKIYYLYVPMVYCCTFSTNVEGTLQLEECL